MNPEAVLRLEMRFVAVEHMIAMLFTHQYRTLGLSADEIRAAHESMRDNLASRTFPEVDPAFSDLLASELQTALERLLRQIEELAGIQKG